MDTDNKTTDFYDAVAKDYHWLYRNWDAELEREGLNLRRYLRNHGVQTVLDASCGIGTQAVALARLGYRVTAVDPSLGLLERARHHAGQYQVADRVTFLQTDFLSLHHHLSGPYDAVVTKGNSLPHLLYDEQIEEALLIFYELLRPGGMLLIGMQDFDMLLDDRPRFWPGQIHDEPDEQIITFDIWDWDDGPPVTVTLNNFIVRGNGVTYRVNKHPVVLRALTTAELEMLMLDIGFENVQVQRDRWEILIIASRPA